MDTADLLKKARSNPKDLRSSEACAFAKAYQVRQIIRLIDELGEG